MSTTTAGRQPADTASRIAPPATISPFPGVFWDDGTGTGTYCGRDGTEHQCVYREASELARREGIILTHRYSDQVEMASGQVSRTFRGSDSNGEKTNELGSKPRFHRVFPSRNPSLYG